MHRLSKLTGRKITPTDVKITIVPDEEAEAITEDSKEETHIGIDVSPDIDYLTWRSLNGQ